MSSFTLIVEANSTKVIIVIASINGVDLADYRKVPVTGSYSTNFSIRTVNSEGSTLCLGNESQLANIKSINKSSHSNNSFSNCRV